ncbi:hypothetical protein EMPS_07636 [Entomortierella parvispora]|uniref:Uncharacterized protein n=1 Tax=Entomortierella parvispora TaxID=205924 RepID=A0A9P3LYM6_9FUNG|nr:hypothetical protein EMPS_07636 [Entomortierella parvispora]
MERSFSHLLRTSRLATYDRSIGQIYTTPSKAKAVGDWGLKRNLPTVLRTHLLKIEQLDTAEHQTPFQSGSSEFLFLQRWKENFPRSRPPQPQPITVKKDLSAMSELEFQKLLQEAKGKRQAWKEALAKNEVKAEDHLQFMDIQTKSIKASQYDTNPNTSMHTAQSATIVAGSNTKAKVGPTYGFYEPSTPTIVQGRSLGQRRQNPVIGVSGVVAHLPSYAAPQHQNLSKSLQSFYVSSAELEADGRPNVVLSLTPPPAAGSWMANSGREQRQRNLLPQGADSTNMDDSAYTSARRRVVSRVNDLLDKRDQSTTRS